MSKPRKRFFTHPRFQAAFAFSFIRGVLISVFLPAGTLFLTLYLLAQDPGVTRLQKIDLMRGANHLILLFLGMSAVLVILFGTLGVYLSYKFAGPIRRIESWLVHNASNLKIETIKTRPGDELSMVTHLLNRLFNR